MKKRFLIIVLIALLSSFSYGQTISKKSNQIYGEVLNISGFPIQLKDAYFTNLKHRADLDYKVINISDEVIWNFEIRLFFVDTIQNKIKNKIDVCVEVEIEEEGDKCRYFPPFPFLEPQHIKKIDVMLDDKVELNTKVFFTIKGVRGEKGIWQIDESKLDNAVLNYFLGKDFDSVKTTKLNHIKITQDDISEVIKSTLEKGLIDKQIPDYNLLKIEEI